MNSMKNKRTRPGSYQELRMWAEAFADAQEARVAFENKERSGDVEMEASSFGEVVALYKEAEKRLERELVDCYRMTVPAGVREWQEKTAGIGEHTLARLLGITGDPRAADPRHWEGTGTERHLVDDPPHERTIGQLWQYAGHGSPKNRDVKGNAAALMANGQPDAKKLVHLLAQSQVKSNAKGGTGYRHVYDEAKARYAEKVHSGDCPGGFSGALYVKCKTGPGGAYAKAGDPYQKSHLHAIALRLTGKEILRDLWLACGPVPEHLDHRHHYDSGQGTARPRYRP
jgi:hypothetical protein